MNNKENTKWVTSPDDYECPLSKETQKVAADELRETEHVRDVALASMRTWILQNQRIVRCRFDSNFLLRFLRTKKFSVVQAQEALERYILLRQTWEGLSRFDCNLPRMQELLDLGFIFPCPKRDSMGRKLVVIRLGVLDTTKFCDRDVIRVVCLTFETLMEDEENQVRGYTYFVDVKGMNMSFVTMFNPREFTRMIKNGEKIIPLRSKKAYSINLPSSYMKSVADFVLSFLNNKHRKRICICDSGEMAFESGLEKNLLPKEYGGEVPLTEMIANWKEELKKMNKVILLNDEIRVREGRYSAKARAGAVSALKESLDCTPCGEDEDQWYITGNFRKLEVD